MMQASVDVFWKKNHGPRDAFILGLLGCHPEQREEPALSLPKGTRYLYQKPKCGGSSLRSE